MCDHINTVQTQGKERNQYRKIIKFLKKWKSVAFENSTKNATPPSVALTMMCAEFFEYEMHVG